MKPMAQSNRRRKLVLLIEDEQGIRTLVAEVCRSERYEVIEARAGRPGAQPALANPPHVILLDLLAANRGRVLTRAQLLEKVWGYLADVDYHSVDPHIQRLRKKLESRGEAGIAVEAVPGLGYRLTARAAGDTRE